MRTQRIENVRQVMRARLARKCELACRRRQIQDMRQARDGTERRARHLADLDHDLLAHLNHAFELVVGALRQHTSAVHDHDAAANLLDFLHVMAGIHTVAPSSRKRQMPSRMRCDSAGHCHRRLVKEDELGLVRNAAGNVEATRQAARELAGAKLGKVAQAHKSIASSTSARRRLRSLT